MSNFFEFEFDEFSKYVENLSKNIKNMDQTFLADIANELGAGLIRSLKELTPVGQYDGTVFFVRGGKLMKFKPKGARGRVGGYLAQSWFFDPARPGGMTVTFEAYNTAYYAQWVNDGHRNATGTGWVEGQFFVEDALDDVSRNMDAIIENRFLAYLERLGF